MVSGRSIGKLGTFPGTLVLYARIHAMSVCSVFFMLQWGRASGQTAFSLSAVEHRPTYTQNETGGQIPGPPINLRMDRLVATGDEPGVDPSKNVSKFTYIGCFTAALSITTGIQDENYDPNVCLALCKNRYPQSPTSKIIFGVHLNRCACIVTPIGFTFITAGAGNCQENSCGKFRNPLCGGNPNYWGVFREYDFQALSTQGTYDPWRYIWYTVVAVREINIVGGVTAPDGVMPERYFLHAVSRDDGRALYEYQMEIPSGLIYGIHYDIDSSRLVGLFTPAATGRIMTNAEWQYKLCIIYVNSTIKQYPRLMFSLKDVSLQKHSDDILGFSSGVSAIFSKIDVYVLVQTQQAPEKHQMKDRIYFVGLPNGNIISQHALDFKIVQMFSNEKYGDLTAIGPRLPIGAPIGRQMYVYLGRVFYSQVESQTRVDWGFNPINPQLVVPYAETQAFHLYPGLAASEHIYNKSAIAHRYLNPGNSTFLIYEVNIRNEQTQMWCQTPCQGSLHPDIPYAGLFNREPGIPLSLKSPSFLYANFSMDAGSIYVEFDRATTKGARQIDDDGDYIPDRIDTSTVRDSTFDCAEVFDDATVLLLGPYNSTTCLWQTSSTLRIRILGYLNISVGDSLFVRADTIYTQRSTGAMADEWSQAASGGVQVDFPFPLEYPVIVPDGGTAVDPCRPLRFSVVDSTNTGRAAIYRWRWGEGDNPFDMTSNPTRKFDPVNVQIVKEYLDNATRANNATLTIPSKYLEPQAAYNIQVGVTSRWLLETNKSWNFTKTNYPKPTVRIEGPQVIMKTRAEKFTLEAKGTPSDCDGADQTLAYQWVEVSGKFNFVDHPNVIRVAAALSIDPFTLEPSQSQQYNDYQFAVSCFVPTLFGDVPATAAVASVTVRIQKSAVFVRWSSEVGLITRGDTLVLDVRGSQDPDYPTDAQGTFRGTFQWSCMSPKMEPCFPAASTSGDLTDLTDCTIDVTQPQFTSGGKSFYQPQFEGKQYCRYARGVLMFDTTTWGIGVYTFAVVATHDDGRQATGQTQIEITEVRVPRFLLTRVPIAQKYPTTEKIRITGNEEGTPTGIQPVFSWHVFQRQRNSDYNQELANERANDPQNPYTVPPTIFVNVSDQYDAADPARFQSRTDSPNLVIYPNVLLPSTRWKFRLVIQVGVAEGYAETTFETAGLPPSGGTLTCDPVNATMDTQRTLTAASWVADDLPLTYLFGVIRSANGVPVRNAFTTDPVQVTTRQVQNLPQGEASREYRLDLYVSVSTRFGAFTETIITVVSRPPANVTQAINDLVDKAAKADPANVVNDLNNLLTLDPKNPDVQNQVLATLNKNQDQIPPTQAQLTSQASLINSLVDSGATGEAAMTGLENMVISSASTGAFSADPNAPGGALAGLAFSAMGGLMPGTAPTGAQGQSVQISMSKSRGTNYAFQAPRQDRPSPFIEGDRQSINHPPLKREWDVVRECNTPFCDRLFIACLHGKGFSGQGFAANLYVCCPAENPATSCKSPPCWFFGSACPSTQWYGGAAQGQRRLHQNPVSRDSGSQVQTAVPGIHLWRGSRQEHRAYLPSSWDEWPNRNKSSLLNKNLSKQNKWTFFTDAPDAASIDEWRSSSQGRRLQYEYFDDRASPVSEAEKIEYMATIEVPGTDQAKLLVADAERQRLKLIRDNATQELSFNSMSDVMATRLRDQADKRYRDQVLFQYQLERNKSQRITRLNVLRDTVAKSLIPQLIQNEIPLEYKNPSFTITIGKTTNLSSVSNKFRFPNMQMYVVPPDSPDNPTATSNLTGFSFIFVQYTKNIYEWSPSNPPSPGNALITLLVLKANTEDFDVRSSPVPIQIFADYDLFSSAVCLYWDRLAAGTPGGQWSSQGISNDGKGCVTTHLSDIGIFIDGRVHRGDRMVTAAADFDRDIIDSQCIGCDVQRNLFILAVLVFSTFAIALFALAGCVMDCRMREQLKEKKITSRYYKDGDGVKSAVTVDDPIAYRFHNDLPMLWIFTLVNVAVREHAVVGLLFYHETFARDQRVCCFAALVSGLMAVNAVVHNHPGYIQQAREYVISGVLSGLLIFPVFCGLMLMFTMRPAMVKKKLVKRAASTKTMEQIIEDRKKLANESSMMPPPGYAALPPVGPHGNVHVPGTNSLLNIPAPLPLPPLPPGAPTGGLAALPPPPPGKAVSGFSGMLALPARPGMTASNPAPPRFPPPAKTQQLSPRALLPPLQFPRVGPPKSPFPAIMGMGPEASLGGTNNASGFLQLPAPVPADTGSTLDAPRAGATNLSTTLAVAPPTLQGTAQSSGPRRVLQPEEMHNAPPPILQKEDMHSAPPPVLQKEEMHSMAPGLPGSLPGDITPPAPMQVPQREPTSFMPGSSSRPTTPAKPAPAKAPEANLGATAGTPSNTFGGGTMPMSGAGTLTAAMTTQGNQNRIVPVPPPPPLLAPNPMGSTIRPLFLRGQPSPGLPAPFSSTMAGPASLAPWAKMGMVPPTGGPPPKTGTLGFPLPPMMPPPMVPPPPPPPKEDESVFKRRLELTYTNRLLQEHEKLELLEDHEQLGKETPKFVFETMTILPYVACATFTISSVFVVLQYGMKFVRWQEEVWARGTIVGLAMILVLLEGFRIIMMTLVELRKYETRRNYARGDFDPHRVKKPEDYDKQEMPPPRLMRNFAVPKVPSGKPPGPPPNRRPAHLPPPNDLSASMTATGGPPRSLPPAKGTAPLRLPVGASAPPTFSATALAAARGHSPSHGVTAGSLTPKSARSGTGRDGSTTPPRQPLSRDGSTTPPRQPLSRSNTPQGGPVPKLESAADLLNRFGGGGTPGPPSPAPSNGSLRGMMQPFRGQMEASRHSTQPPPPNQMSDKPPPPPTDPARNFSRRPTGSRPSSANVGNPTPASVPPPPVPSNAPEPSAP